MMFGILDLGIVNVDCAMEVFMEVFIYSNKSLSMSMEGYLNCVNWGETTHPQGEQYHSLGWSLTVTETEE